MAACATSLILNHLGIEPGISISSGFLAGAAADIIVSGMMARKKSDDFRNIPSGDEQRDSIERRIKEFEASHEGGSRNIFVKMKDAFLKYPKANAALLTIAAFYDRIAYQAAGLPLKIYSLLPHDQGMQAAANRFIELCRSGNIDDIVLKNYAILIPAELAFFGFATIFSRAARDLLHSAFYRQAKHVFRGLQAELINDAEKAIDAYTEAHRIGGGYSTRLAALYMRDDRSIDMALKVLSERSRTAEEREGYGTGLAKASAVSRGLRLEREIRRNPGEIKYLLRLAYHHLTLFDAEKSLKVMDEAETRFSDDYRARFLHAEILESAGRPEEAMVKYLEAGRILLRTEDIMQNFSCVGDFRNELFIHKFDRYIKNLIAIKRNADPARLKTEKQQILALKPYFGGKISDFLCDFEDKGFYHLFLKYICGKNLHQLMLEGHYGPKDRQGGRADDNLPGHRERYAGLFEDLSECVELLRDIENIGILAYRDSKISLSSPLDISREYFPNKIANAVRSLEESGIILSDEEKKRIMEGFRNIAVPLHALPRRFYTDSNIMNFMKNHEIRKIDFENDELLPPIYFFVNVCEFGGDYLDDDAKHSLKQSYWGDQFDIFDRFLPFGAAQRHMEMAGYRSRDIANARKKGKEGQFSSWSTEARLFHLKNASEYGRRIIDNAGDYELYAHKAGLNAIEKMVGAVDDISARI
ncbi:hypothetical protein COV19_05045 [Candidatus Woesearchaeota archaeon CG10_big_fil_rev_8_21_14_0_10_44_13]|nr:MAG: hypothetical protein COV19_05045 [Candidatus Woesearchaeota archaeon CG10_big_fil_rev_8_21_14_0_10_44_13]